MRPAHTYRVTVMTPSRNGADTIHRVFESLEAQTLRDFEWVVIDDGSTDGLSARVAELAEKASFPVVLHRFEQNCGRPSAFNQGIELARGEFLLSVDDDDRIVPEALETLVAAWDRYAPTVDEPLGGVVALCADQDGRLQGTQFPGDPWIGDMFEEAFRYHLRGERCRMTRTDVWREHPWPTDVDWYLLASSVWFEIHSRYRMIYINEVLRIYYRNEPGRETLSRVRQDHPLAYRYAQLRLINAHMSRVNGDRPFAADGRKIFRSYLYESLRAGIGLRRSFGDVCAGRHRLALLCFLPGVVLKYTRRRLLGRRR